MIEVANTTPKSRKFTNKKTNQQKKTIMSSLKIFGLVVLSCVVAMIIAILVLVALALTATDSVPYDTSIKSTFAEKINVHANSDQNDRHKFPCITGPEKSRWFVSSGRYNFALNIPPNSVTNVATGQTTKLTHSGKADGVDARMFSFNDEHYLLFCDDDKLMSIIQCNDDGDLDTDSVVQLRFSGMSKFEKNWTPYVFQDKLHFITRLHPLQVVELTSSCGQCVIVKDEHPHFQWDNDITLIRGGSPLMPSIEHAHLFVGMAHTAHKPNKFGEQLSTYRILMYRYNALSMSIEVVSDPLDLMTPLHVKYPDLNPKRYCRVNFGTAIWRDDNNDNVMLGVDIADSCPLIYIFSSYDDFIKLPTMTDAMTTAIEHVREYVDKRVGGVSLFSSWLSGLTFRRRLH
jgi:hypothetical protein